MATCELTFHQQKWRASEEEWEWWREGESMKEDTEVEEETEVKENREKGDDMY